MTPETVAEFQANGFVVTDNIFTEAELQRFGYAVDGQVAERNAADHRSVDEKTTYEQSFIQCMRLWETDPVVREFSFHAGLAETAATLLGVDGLRLWQDQALYKEAGGRETTPHQDLVFWPIDPDADLISAWIPLDGSTIESGAMAYVPGSHLAGGLKPVDITHRTEPYDILADPALGGADPTWVEAPAGSVVWHHGLTVHQASANTTDETRRVFTVVFLAEGTKRTKPWKLMPLDRDGIEVGDVIAGPGLPTVWPTPEPLPEPPALIGQATGPQH